MESAQIFILVGVIIFVILLEIVYITRINIKKLIPINYLIIFLIFFIPILSTTVYILYSNSIKTPPMPKTCPRNCSGNGTCDTSTGKCTCNTNFTGDDCSTTSGGVKVCGNGYFLDGNTCTKCRAGTYSISGASVCTNCKAGTYSTDGASVCTNCKAGTYSTDGASVCSNCKAGTFSSKEGASVCTNCEAGTYSSKEGASSCTNCKAGTYSTEGSSVCANCKDGTYSDDAASSCLPCPDGYDCVNGIKQKSSSSIIGYVFGGIAAVILLGFGFYFLTRQTYNKKSNTAPPITTANKHTTPVSVVTTHKTFEQGDCFFSGIYRGAEANNCLQTICQRLNLNCAGEEIFIKDFRNKVAEDPDLIKQYKYIFDRIKEDGYEKINKSLQIETDFGGTKDVIKLYNRIDENQFINLIKDKIKQKGSYVGSYEVQAAVKILQNIGITLKVWAAAYNEPKPKKIEPNTIYLCYNCTSLPDHYEYFF